MAAVVAADSEGLVDQGRTAVDQELIPRLRAGLPLRETEERTAQLTTDTLPVVVVVVLGERVLEDCGAQMATAMRPAIRPVVMAATVGNLRFRRVGSYRRSGTLEEVVAEQTTIQHL